MPEMRSIDADLDAMRGVSEMTNVLAIDQGTSGTNAIVADDAGRVLGIEIMDELFRGN